MSQKEISLEERIVNIKNSIFQEEFESILEYQERLEKSNETIDAHNFIYGIYNKNIKKKCENLIKHNTNLNILHMIGYAHGEEESEKRKLTCLLCGGTFGDILFKDEIMIFVKHQELCKKKYLCNKHLNCKHFMNKIMIYKGTSVNLYVGCCRPV